MKISDGSLSHLSTAAAVCGGFLCCYTSVGDFDR